MSVRRRKGIKQKSYEIGTKAKTKSKNRLQEETKANQSITRKSRFRFIRHRLLSQQKHKKAPSQSPYPT